MGGVRIVKQETTMEHYSQDPFRPHPVFPQWSSLNVYPYQYWGSMRKYVVRQKYYMPALENDYLRVTIAPDIGGRIWDIYDKIGGHHLANFNSGVRSYNAGFGLNYTTGGIECNYPTAHSTTTNTKREVGTARYPDGSAAVIVGEYDRIWRTRWSVAYILHPDRSYVQLRVRIYNRTAFDSRYLYWNNCGFVLKDHTKFIIPEDAGAQHGEEKRAFWYPTWRHQDLSHWRNVPQMLGLYMLDAREPYFGYYEPSGQYGLVHYGDLADLPGKKYWTWGSDPQMVANYRKTHHSEGEVYGEVQSGRIVIQEHTDRVPPETECEWSEFWYPVRDTGEFNGAGAGAAIRAEVLDAGDKQSRIRVRAMGNGTFPNAVLIVSQQGLTPAEVRLPLSPRNAVERIVTLKGRAGPAQRTGFVIRDAQAGILAACALREPNKRDSWLEIPEKTPPPTPTEAEELYRVAEAHARDWGNHDLKSSYEAVLRKDDAFSPARRELGKLALWQGLPKVAVEHLEIAAKRDPDSLENRYFLGLAYDFAGRTDDARQRFELANRYDWETRSLARLAELRMREQDWHHALTHLQRLAEVHPRLTRSRGLRAACLRKLGRTAEAAAEIGAALQIDAQDPFLQFEAMIGQARGATPKLFPAKALKALIEQVRGPDPTPGTGYGAEPPLLEAAFDYLSASLFEEADAVLQVIPNAGPITTFVKAHVANKLKGKAAALALLRRACRQDVVGQHAWHLELIPILEWARAQLPKEPRVLLHLGNLLMARRRTQDGLQLWREAERLGEKHPLLFAGLGFYAGRVAKDATLAAEYFKRAAQADPADLYVKHELYGALRASGKKDDALRYMEGEKKAVALSPLLAHDLLDSYLERSEFRKFDELCRGLDFTPNWQIPGPPDLWMRRQIMEAISVEREGRLDAALEILRNLQPAPARLGVTSYKLVEADRVLYHMGRIHEKLGQKDEARKCWEKALTYTHGSWWEPGYWPGLWTRRYYQALSLMKLGRVSEADTYFDGMEMAAKSTAISMGSSRQLMDLVERGRFAPDAEKDPIWQAAIKEATRAEE